MAYMKTSLAASLTPPLGRMKLAALELFLGSQQANHFEQRQVWSLFGKPGETLPVLRAGREDPLAKGIGRHSDDIVSVALDQQELVIPRRAGQTADLLDLAIRQAKVDPEAFHRLTTGLADQL